jgi:hypothetical protein
MQGTYIHGVTCWINCINNSAKTCTPVRSSQRQPRNLMLLNSVPVGQRIAIHNASRQDTDIHHLRIIQMKWSCSKRRTHGQVGLWPLSVFMESCLQASTYHQRTIRYLLEKTLQSWRTSANTHTVFLFIAEMLAAQSGRQRYCVVTYNAAHSAVLSATTKTLPVFNNTLRHSSFLPSDEEYMDFVRATRYTAITSHGGMLVVNGDVFWSTWTEF